jgi:thiol-disulfide isomerase/thioredoxin
MSAFALHLLLAFQTAVAPQPSAGDVLNSAIRAVGTVHAAAYVVKRDYADAAGNSHKGSTTIIAVKSPLRFRAAHELEGDPRLETAVSNGETTQFTDDGKLEEKPTFASSPADSMIVTNDATFDVAATWHLLLDVAYLEKARASGRILYLWQDDVEDDRCDVIVYARDHWTDYLWISTKTGLPRAMQRVTFRLGRAAVTPRYQLTDIRLEPAIPPGIFDFERGSGDSGAAHNTNPAKETPPSARTAPDVAPARHIGESLPRLEVRSLEYKPSLLSDFKGRPTLITFWAPWCAPCREELAAVQNLPARIDGRLQVVAVAVQDRREKAIEFVRDHQYGFLFFTDPDMEDESSKLLSFFGIQGVPVNVLCNPQGKVVDYWFGFSGGEQFRNRVNKLFSDATP